MPQERVSDLIALKLQTEQNGDVWKTKKKKLSWMVITGWMACQWQENTCLEIWINTFRKKSKKIANRSWFFFFFQIMNDVIGEYFQCYTSLNKWQASNRSSLRLRDNGNRSMTPVLRKCEPENKLFIWKCSSSCACPKRSLRLIMGCRSSRKGSSKVNWAI